MNSLFFEQYEEEAIGRIKKFAKIAKRNKFTIIVGFSGGKDSQVVYDLCKRANIDFIAYYNVAFESNTTKKFIKDNYPSVIWRRVHKLGFIENIAKKHNGLLPTVQKAYCCEDYKHNTKYIDDCTILGVRKEESRARSGRTALAFKNKTTQKKINVEEFFKDRCTSIGSKSIIQLLPIVEWSEQDVWHYIKKYNLPINPEYKYQNRVGCIICPKTNFSRNYIALLKYPKLIDAIIKAREVNPLCDWVITNENKDYTDDKVTYICRWLNHSFMKFTKKQEELAEQVKQNYLKNGVSRK